MCVRKSSNFTYALIILSIFATGIFLRFYNLENFATFGHDNSRDLILLYKLYTYKEWIYRGPVFSLVWAFLSPIYYYILFPFYFLMKFNPLAPAIFSTFLNILALVAMWWVSKKLFGIKASIVSTLIYATSFLIVREGASGFNPSFMPVFSILFFYALYQIIVGRPKHLILLAFCTAMLISFHPSGFFIPLVLIVMLFIYRSGLNLKKNYTISSFLVFFTFGIFPYIFQEKKFNWWSIHKIIEYIHKPAGTGATFGTFNLIEMYFKILLNNLSTTFFATSTGVFVVLLSVTLSIILFSNLITRERKSATFVLTLFLSIYLAIFGSVVKFYKIGLYEGWFQTVYIPFVVLLFGATFFKAKNFLLKYGLILMIFSSVILNIISYVSYEPEDDKFSSQKEMSEVIRKDSAGQAFSIIGKDAQPLYYILWYYESDAIMKDQYYSWIKWGNNKTYDLAYFIGNISNPLKSDNNTKYNRLISQSNGRVLYRVTYRR